MGGVKSGRSQNWEESKLGGVKMGGVKKSLSGMRKIDR